MRARRKHNRSDVIVIVWLWMAWACAVECPTHDLYAHKLDAYSVEVEDEVVQFKLSVDKDAVTEPDTQVWVELLRACAADETLEKFVQWQRSWKNLSALGIEYQSANWIDKWHLKREIRTTERRIVMEYAQMLEHFELETGVSVLWNVEQYSLAKGMVSAGRGSPKVYQYIYNQFNFVQ